MTKEELQKIIDQFDEVELKKLGIFSIMQYGGGPDESFIRANKEGLELFAIELLKSSRDAEEILIENEKNIILLNHEESWIHEYSDTVIQWVEPIKDKQSFISNNEEKDSIWDKFIPIGCVIVLITIVISAIVGFKSIIEWII